MSTILYLQQEQEGTVTYRTKLQVLLKLFDEQIEHWNYLLQLPKNRFVVPKNEVLHLQSILNTKIC